MGSKKDCVVPSSCVKPVSAAASHISLRRNFPTKFRFPFTPPYFAMQNMDGFSDQNFVTVKFRLRSLICRHPPLLVSHTRTEPHLGKWENSPLRLRSEENSAVCWKTRGILDYRKVKMLRCVAKVGADLSAEALAKADNQQETQNLER